MIVTLMPGLDFLCNRNGGAWIRDTRRGDSRLHEITHAWFNAKAQPPQHEGWYPVRQKQNADRLLLLYWDGEWWMDSVRNFASYSINRPLAAEEWEWCGIHIEQAYKFGSGPNADNVFGQHMPYIALHHPELRAHKIEMMAISIDELDAMVPEIEESMREIVEEQEIHEEYAWKDAIEKHTVKCNAPPGHLFARLTKDGSLTYLIAVKVRE